MVVGSGVEAVGNWSLVIGNWEEALGMLAPKLLRRSERSVRSMVGALSKLPEVQAEVVAPKLLRMVERSVRSTWPSMLASPRSSGARRRESVLTSRPWKVVNWVMALSRTARASLAGREAARMPVG